MHMGLTTVDILKMWLFTAELLQVMLQVETIVVTILLMTMVTTSTLHACQTTPCLPSSYTL